MKTLDLFGKVHQDIKIVEVRRKLSLLFKKTFPHSSIESIVQWCNGTHHLSYQDQQKITQHTSNIKHLSLPAADVRSQVISNFIQSIQHISITSRDHVYLSMFVMFTVPSAFKTAERKVIETLVPILSTSESIDEAKRKLGETSLGNGLSFLTFKLFGSLFKAFSLPGYRDLEPIFKAEIKAILNYLIDGFYEQ